MLSIQVYHYIAAKRGYVLEECEDAYAFSEDGAVLAVADGATQASFSREWAQALVKAFVASKPDDPSDAFVRAAFDEWKVAVGDVSRLPWYAQVKLERGSFAAFAGVRVDLVSGRCFAKVLGDSCLFIIDDALGTVSPFPYADTDEMARYPFLVSTNLVTDLTGKWKEDTRKLNIPCTLMLTTDAIARFILSSMDQFDIAKKISSIVAEGTTDEFFSELLESGQMVNDDICVLTAHVSGERMEDEIS